MDERLTLLFDDCYTELFNGKLIAVEEKFENIRYVNIYTSDGEIIVSAKLAPTFIPLKNGVCIVGYLVELFDKQVVNTYLKSYYTSIMSEIEIFSDTAVLVLGNDNKVHRGRFKIYRYTRQLPSIVLNVGREYYSGVLENKIIKEFIAIG